MSILRVPQVIAADGEQKAARALKQASETISESSSAMQLRYLQASDKLSLDTLELLNFDMNSFSESWFSGLYMVFPSNMSQNE